MSTDQRKVRGAYLIPTSMKKEDAQEAMKDHRLCVGAEILTPDELRDKLVEAGVISVAVVHPVDRGHVAQYMLFGEDVLPPPEKKREACGEKA